MSNKTITTPFASTRLRRFPRRGRIDGMMSPRSIALIGATESPCSVGAAIMRNLTRGDFNGSVYPVNPKYARVMGLPAFPDVASIGRPVDLAIIATPATSVPRVVEQCAAAGIDGAIIISAGFKEAGATGAALERCIAEISSKTGIRIIGPNCLGVMNPHAGLNATFAASMARPGSVGFLSQSGALCTAILDWSFSQQIGFSSFVSVGSMLDVGWGDLIDYLGNDPHTKSIVIYMESIGDARSFLSAAREVALSKPIIVIKVGRTEAAGRAAASHTGAMTGSDEVLDAAFLRAGVLRVNTIAELFDMVDVLATQPRPAGPRLSIVTNAGGPGVLATDTLIANGGELAPLSPSARAQLDELLPPHWSRANPIDVLGDASPARYARAAEIASEQPDSDGTLVILTPQAMTDPTETARRLTTLRNHNRKPILASWMGDAGVTEAKRILRDAGIPTFAFPDAAARAFCYMWQYSKNIDALYETPARLEETGQSGTRSQCVSRLLAASRAAGTTILDEVESKRVLEAYGIPTTTTIRASNADEAAEAAMHVGFPVAVKLVSSTITHKSDVGGVRLNLQDVAAVRDAFASIRQSVADKFGEEHFNGVSVQPMVATHGYEVILGSTFDPQFGPVLMFGAGGQLVEILQDRVLGLPPLSCTLARRMLEQTKIYRAFKGVRGRKPVDIARLENLLVHFSQLVLDQPLIKEIEINPLLVGEDEIVALDARIILHAVDTDLTKLVRPAIRPYPSQYVEPCALRDGTLVTIRPIRPDDEPAIIEFHESLSEETVRQRYLATMKLSERTAHSRLRRICFSDYDREIVLVAEHTTASGQREILAIGRINREGGDRDDAEFAIVVSTPWQGKGLGSELLERLIKIAADEAITRITGHMFAGNRAMIAIARRIGFAVRYDPDGATCTAELSLTGDERFSPAVAPPTRVFNLSPSDS